MTRPSAKIIFTIALIAACLTLTAGTHRASTPPTNPTDDALGIGPMSGASIRGIVASVQGTLITLNTGGAPAIMIETSAAKFMSDHNGTASLADIKPGVRITAFLNTAPTTQPSSALRAQLVTIESQPDLQLTGTIDSIDVPHSRFVVLGITITADANTGTVKSIGTSSWVITGKDGKDTTVTIDAQTKIIGDPKVGDTVQVMATIDSAHNYNAIAIVKIEQHDVTTTELHGTVKSIAATQWVIGGPPGTLAPDFIVKIASTTVIYPDPKVGDRVVAVGTRDATGAFTATKISKEN
jgi:hypothetical protein